MKKLSNLSYSELNDLEKAIKEEKSRRETIKYKSELNISERLYNLLHDDLSDELSDEEIHRYTGSWEASITKICDVITGNYIVKEAKTNKKIYCNTSNVAVNVDPENYTALVNDIFEVFYKHHKKEDK
jgi:hypothetical protein